MTPDMQRKITSAAHTAGQAASAAMTAVLETFGSGEPAPMASHESASPGPAGLHAHMVWGLGTGMNSQSLALQVHARLDEGCACVPSPGTNSSCRMLCAALFAQAAFRDVQHQDHVLIYTSWACSC